MKLQPKIITIVLTITLGCNILLQLYNIENQRGVAIEKLYTKIERTNTLLAHVNGELLFDFNMSLVEANLKAFLNDPEIKSIYLIESSGLFDLFFENDNISNKDLIETEIDVFYENEKVGKIITTFSKGLINEQSAFLIKGMFVAVIAITLVVFIVLFILLKRIIKPIVDLTELSTAASNGNLDIDFKVNTKDEIGTLATSFMKMRDSIKLQIQFLSIENEERNNAEIKLRQKTNELATVNSELLRHRSHLEELVVKRTSELQDSLDRLEETKDQLVESEKMASLGDLVAGVAHEINTPVGIGVTAASYLESETNEFIEAYNVENYRKLYSKNIQNWQRIAQKSYFQIC